MKTRHVLTLALMVLAVGIVGLFPALSGSATASALSSTVTWIDNFDSSTLNSRWSWIREDPTHWSLTANPGFLRITTQTGSLKETSNNQNNLLLTGVPTGDFTITTKVTIPVSQNKQNAGIFVYEDDDNVLALLRIFNSGHWVSFGGEVGGTYTMAYTSESATTVYLRIAREGSSYTGSYSSDGIEWNTVGQHTINLVNLKVGIGACNGDVSGTPEITADFDSFQLDYTPYKLILPLITK